MRRRRVVGARCVDVCGREGSVLCGRKTGLPRLYLRGGRPPQADVVEGILREPQQPNGISEVDDAIISVLCWQRFVHQLWVEVRDLFR